jgi:enoyl-CoA hydratase/3-hydroxyacyl-CoA dehydrogenase
MALNLFGRSVQRVGVVGSGNIGPDIALFFSRALAPHGVSVVVHDVVQDPLDRGRSRILKKLQKSESGTFKPAEAESVLRNLTFTLDKSLLTGCDLVVEAAVEKLDTKQQIHDELERIVRPDAVLASNSSHLTPERIFERARRPERCLVHHFFFPADRNPVVEIVPHPRTQVADWCARFYEALGRVPVRSKSRFGFSVNPVFEGVFLACALLVEQGLPPGIVDAIASRVLGMGAGPFTLLNLTGASPLTRAGLEQYHEIIMPWFRCPDVLAEKVETKEPWETIDKGDTLAYSNAVFDRIRRQLLGAYFGVACEVVESGVAGIGDLDLAVELALGARAPFSFMNELGPERVRELVEAFAAEHPGFRVPKSFGPFEIPHVFREDRDGVAVLTIKRPRTLNALNRAVLRQLEAEVTKLRDDPSVRGAVITGFGTRAFVSGADISMLASIKSPDQARELARSCHSGLRKIETLGKPVVCALNGLSLGGGSEIAYACTARIARRGLRVLFGQPEPKVGVIPGGGATQRLPRLIDFSAAWRLLRTASTLSGEDALRLGLVSEEVSADRLLDRACELARTLTPAPPLAPPRVPATLPDVDLANLSRRLDEILRRAVLGGAVLPLDEALALEADAFAEAYTTRDCQIGLENFLRTNLKQPASFVHA